MLNEIILNSVVDILTRCSERIKANMAAGGINASKRTSDAIKVVTDDAGARLVAAAGDVAPLYTLEVGRRAGTPPPFIKIYNWTIDKGLSFEDDKQRRSASFAIRRIIAATGTRRSRENVDTYTTPVNDATLELKQVIKTYIAQQIKSYIKTESEKK